MSGDELPIRPALYGDRARWGLVHADSLHLLPLLPDKSVDAVVTDPPYGIEFGGHDWDGGHLTSLNGFATWTTLWARELKRVLRPGGYAAIFGAPRTMHRLVVDIGASRVRDEVRQRVTSAGQVLARWPANLGLIHSLGCDFRRCAGECAVRLIDQQSGKDVSRFFYAAKASRTEREAGLEDHVTDSAPIFSGSGVRPRANAHPTVKPLSVMRWLVRLITPRYGVVLDPFSGSGSTGCAALLEDRQFVGIEREADYIEIARRRLSHWAQES